MRFPDKFLGDGYVIGNYEITVDFTKVASPSGHYWAYQIRVFKGSGEIFRRNFKTNEIFKAKRFFDTMITFAKSTFSSFDVMADFASTLNRVLDCNNSELSNCCELELRGLENAARKEVERYD